MSETREAAYERAAELYADGLRVGGKAMEAIGTARYRIRPDAQEWHRNVLAVAEFLVTADPVPPGPCWHDSGATWPDGFNPRCDLLAGHAGAHTCERPNGGTAVWTEAAAVAGTEEA